MRRIIEITFLVLVLLASNVSAASPAATATENVGHYAENLFDWGRQSDWTKARADLTSLRTAVASLDKTGEVTDLRAANAQVAAIGQAVQNRQSRALMHAANELTRITARISRQFNPQVPAEVTLLDYYGRELELWSEESNLYKLNETRMKLSETWDIVRPSVVAKGGESEARTFDGLVDRASSAKAPKDFAVVATPILDSVDLLENVFTRA